MFGKYGYCPHCGHEYKTGGLGNWARKCPSCQKKAMPVRDYVVERDKRREAEYCREQAKKPIP